MSFFSSAPSAKGANGIPPPQPDHAKNSASQEQHKREAPAAKYTFDSRINREKDEAELCRHNPDGGRSCVKIAIQSAALFKSMQALGFYCALPADPTHTHMECNRLPR